MRWAYSWQFIVATLQQLISDIRAQKLRAVFATIGIAWGVYAFVVLLAIGQGVYQNNQHNIKKLSQPTIYVRLRHTSEASQGMAPHQRPWFSYEDQMDLLKAFPNDVKAVAPSLSKWLMINYKNRDVPMSVVGKVPASKMIESDELTPGSRYISVLDNQNNHHVAILSHMRATQLFGSANPLGKTISIQGIPFTVIGVLSSESFTGNFSNVIIPYNTAKNMFMSYKPANATLLYDDVDVNAFITRLKSYLARLYHLNNDDQHVFDIFTLTQFRGRYMALLWGLQAFLWFCGLMMLVVGGIGVSNMMYLSVKERTNEIGLKMALGAKSKHVLCQFLLETFLFVILGGLFATALALMTIKVINLIPIHWLSKAHISALTLLMAWGLLALLAFFAGFSPARAAAKLSPVQALRGR
ncbi:MAG: hypothetical protein CMF39_04215 [Legionellaceae bacterium]|nr:hypothetical protein [Legionellaceae bacterium]|tara:strand:+ start:95 stop:1330 length:1236 start_codon:yes stop_codon:yes gene_type:complete